MITILLPISQIRLLRIDLQTQRIGIVFSLVKIFIYKKVNNIQNISIINLDFFTQFSILHESLLYSIFRPFLVHPFCSNGKYREIPKLGLFYACFPSTGQHSFYGQDGNSMGKGSFFKGLIYQDKLRS